MGLTARYNEHIMVVNQGYQECVGKLPSLNASVLLLTFVVR